MIAQVAGLKVIFAFGAAAAASAQSPDGLTYPGQSREAAEYNRRWDAYMHALPSTRAEEERTRQEIGWIIGDWTAQPRDFPSSMTRIEDAEANPPSPATIAWTTGQRWLRISFVAQPYGSEWNYFLGYDPVARRWVLNYVASPSLSYSGPATASAWTSDRLIFTPTTENYKGFRSVSRFVIVRSSPDSFRIVNEVKMPSGKFVAMDDVLFTRR